MDLSDKNNKKINFKSERSSVHDLNSVYTSDNLLESKT